MSWQDAPAVDSAPAWASAPAVDAAAKKPDSAYEVARTMTGRIGDAVTPIGVGEGIASLATGAIAAPIAGLAGAASALPLAFARALGITDLEGANIVRKVQEALAMQPRSQVGQQVVGGVAAPFEKLAEWGTGAGEKVTDVTGSPALGAAVSTGIQAAPMVLGVEGVARAGAVSQAARGAGETVMKSALKPTLDQVRTGKGATATKTMLDEGLNVTKGGAETLRDRIDTLNDSIATLVDKSPAIIDKQRVGAYVQGVIDKFRKQVNATDDVRAIQKAWDEFLNDPNIPANISVKQAQEYKQGTYRTLGDKAYGELKTADIEAQKALARGLKEEIAKAVPEVRALNAQESTYLNTLSVVERRVAVDANKNLAGLAWLASSPEKFAMFMADRSPLFKSLIARMIYSAGAPLEAAAQASSAVAAAGGPATAAQRKKRADELLQTSGQ